MTDSYRTLRGIVERSLRVQGSRFLALAAPAEDRTRAQEEVDRRRTAMFDATHHAFAWRITPDGTDTRSSDDGEPAGSAGRPILAAIDREGLTNVVVVVTRYFGGTKLGVGGLARAYGDAAAGALAAAEKEERTIVAELGIVFPFALTGPVMHVVARTGARVARADYDEQTHMVLEIRRSAGDDLFARLTEATSGAVRREGR